MSRTPDEPWSDFDLVQDAARYAADVHRPDVRKGTAIPYLSHLWSVAALVLEHGGDDAQVAAALLHDVAEDHGGRGRLHDVAARFGDDVAALVEALSDSLVDTDAGEPKAPWHQRKADHLEHLARADARVALVAACDKLHNTRCVLADLRTVGPAVWERFDSSDPADQLWYFEALAAALRPPRVPAALADELQRTVAAIRSETGTSTAIM